MVDDAGRDGAVICAPGAVLPFGKADRVGARAEQSSTRSSRFARTTLRFQGPQVRSAVAFGPKPGPRGSGLHVRNLIDCNLNPGPLVAHR